MSDVALCRYSECEKKQNCYRSQCTPTPDHVTLNLRHYCTEESGFAGFMAWDIPQVEPIKVEDKAWNIQHDQTFNVQENNQEEIIENVEIPIDTEVQL